MCLRFILSRLRQPVPLSDACVTAIVKVSAMLAWRVVAPDNQQWQSGQTGISMRKLVFNMADDYAHGVAVMCCLLMFLSS